MGSLPAKLLSKAIELLAAAVPIRHFVETGTFRGATTEWAAERFDRIDTIEIDSATLAETRTRLARFDVIRYHLGDSRERLPKIIERLEGPAFFWLDAHKGGGYFGQGDDCPILDEIAAINRAPHPTVVLVDDARAFLSPPPPPFDWRHWPELKTILDLACTDPERTGMIFDDVIVCVPRAMRDALRRALHQVKPRL